MLVDGKSGFKSTAQVIDWARERGRPRNDVYEAVVWRDSVTVVDDEVYPVPGGPAGGHSHARERRRDPGAGQRRRRPRTRCAMTDPRWG